MTAHLHNNKLSVASAQDLVGLARQVTGFLDGEVGEAPDHWYSPGTENGPVLKALLEALAREYREAGVPLWATRMWTNLLWQPAYLAFVGVHFGGVVADISKMSQRCMGIHTDGYRLSGDPTVGLGEDEMIARAGAQLRSFADDLLLEINGIVKMKRLPALRLLADRMLGLMTFAQRKRPEIAPATVRSWCRQWLSAMDLTGQGELESIGLADGREALIIARKGCCLDYLIEPHVYCASCPKQPDDLRLKHQRAEAETLMRAG